MSLELAALAFFKSNKIDYQYIKPIIKFPCIECAEEAVMHAITTNWSCTTCGGCGTISALIEYKSEAWSKSKIYNPKKELDKINKLFDDLQLTDKKYQFQKLRNKVTILIEYYESKVP